MSEAEPANPTSDATPREAGSEWPLWKWLVALAWTLVGVVLPGLVLTGLVGRDWIPAAIRPGFLPLLWLPCLWGVSCFWLVRDEPIWRRFPILPFRGRWLCYAFCLLWVAMFAAIAFLFVQLEQRFTAAGL
jgi:hypothetical protein